MGGMSLLVGPLIRDVFRWLKPSFRSAATRRHGGAIFRTSFHLSFCGDATSGDTGMGKILHIHVLLPIRMAGATNRAQETKRIATRMRRTWLVEMGSTVCIPLHTPPSCLHIDFRPFVLLLTLLFFNSIPNVLPREP